MSIIDRLISLLAPHECLGCGAEGSLLCNSCDQELLKIPDRCYRCRKFINNFLTCSKCRKQSRLYRVTPTLIYDGIAKDLIWKLKFEGAQAASRTVALRMSKYLEKDTDVVIVPVPTASKRVRQRGYDQAVLIAKELSRMTSNRYKLCLRRTTQAHQVGANRRVRVKQLHDAFKIRNIRFVKGAHIILVDDVITTGATLEAAALCLKKAGAKKVEAIVYAQP